MRLTLLRIFVSDLDGAFVRTHETRSWNRLCKTTGPFTTLPDPLACPRPIFGGQVATLLCVIRVPGRPVPRTSGDPGEETLGRTRAIRLDKLEGRSLAQNALT